MVLATEAGRGDHKKSRDSMVVKGTAPAEAWPQITEFRARKTELTSDGPADSRRQPTNNNRFSSYLDCEQGIQSNSK